jgi:hypothetical protein
MIRISSALEIHGSIETLLQLGKITTGVRFHPVFGDPMRAFHSTIILRSIRPIPNHLNPETNQPER